MKTLTPMVLEPYINMYERIPPTPSPDRAIDCLLIFRFAAWVFLSATDWLFTIAWWLTGPLAQPVIG